MNKKIRVLTAAFTFLIFFGLMTGSKVQAADVPPSTWQEHWFEHNQLLKLVYYNDDVAVYFDNDINAGNAQWIYPFVTDVWRYTKQTYGDMNGGGRLYVVIHNKYPGGHPAYYYDSSHDYRNVIDVGGSDFSSKSNWNIDAIVHEIGHIVESTTNGAKGSPTFDIWKDSKWCEIYQYDVYKALGMTSDADRLYNSFINKTDSFPQSGTAWFKNWYYPIYSSYGNSKVLSDYFKLLSQYYPKNSSGYYTRSLNMGEYVHFMSKAAGVDLKSLASNAFGWNSTYESQYQAAKNEFPFTYGNTYGATFYEDANYGGWSVSLRPGRYDTGDLASLGIPNDKISSVKITSGLKVTLYENIGFGGQSKTITGDTSSLPDFNDKTSSIVIEAASAPVFYSDANFAGKSITLSEGSYNMNDLESRGLSNDTLSSVRVPFGYKVTLFNDIDYGGNAVVLLADSSGLGDFNDETTSIKVEKLTY